MFQHRSHGCGGLIKQRGICLLACLSRMAGHALYGMAPCFGETFDAENGLLLHLRPNYIHSASNDIHTDGPRARARARARG